MISEELVKQELTEALEAQKANVEKMDAFGYLLTDRKIRTLSHILELDCVHL